MSVIAENYQIMYRKKKLIQNSFMANCLMTHEQEQTPYPLVWSPLIHVALSSIK